MFGSVVFWATDTTMLAKSVKTGVLFIVVKR